MTTEETGGGRRRTAVVAASAGLLIAGAGTVGWAATHQVPEPPSPVASSSSSNSSSSGGATTTSSSSSSGKSASSDKSPTSTPRVAPPSPSTAKALKKSKPTAIRLPKIDVDSPVHGLGLDGQGQLKVPSGELYNEVAWYDGSPTPGEVGPAVLEGHVTGNNQNPSVFFELGATKTGDMVEVDRADGSTATFKVTEVRKYPKADFPRVDVYGATSGPELRIITCGGSYDSSARRHLDNIVVFAKLVKG